MTSSLIEDQRKRLTPEKFDRWLNRQRNWERLRSRLLARRKTAWAK